MQGQIPAKAAPFARTASVDNPTAFFVSAFRAALVAEGVEVIGDAVDIDDFLAKPDVTGARTLVSHRSPPLRQIAASMMRVSQNQYAETLLKAIGGRDQGATGACLKGWNIADDSYVDRGWLGSVTLQLRHVRCARRHPGAYARRCEARGAVRRRRCLLQGAREHSREGLPERRPKDE